MPLPWKLKHIDRGYSNVEKKVREATNKEPWGPSLKVLSELALATYDPDSLEKICSTLWPRLNENEPQKWRRVKKSLLVIDYLLKAGCREFIVQCINNITSIEARQDFQHIAIIGKDNARDIRHIASQIAQLLKHKSFLCSERERFKPLRRIIQTKNTSAKANKCKCPLQIDKNVKQEHLTIAKTRRRKLSLREIFSGCSSRPVMKKGDSIPCDIHKDKPTKNSKCLPEAPQKSKALDSKEQEMEQLRLALSLSCLDQKKNATDLEENLVKEAIRISAMENDRQMSSRNFSEHELMDIPSSSNDFLDQYSFDLPSLSSIPNLDTSRRSPQLGVLSYSGNQYSEEHYDPKAPWPGTRSSLLFTTSTWSKSSTLEEMVKADRLSQPFHSKTENRNLLKRDQQHETMAGATFTHSSHHNEVFDEAMNMGDKNGSWNSKFTWSDLSPSCPIDPFI